MSDTLFDVAATTDPTVYVDPHPGKKGTDLVREDCTFCRGTGVYQAPSGLVIKNPHGPGLFRGCFQCNGYGYHDYKVSSVRSRVRRQAAAAKAWRDGESVRKLAAAVAERNAYAAAWDAALVEQARRDALVTGFVGNVGDKVKATGTVTVATRFEVPGYNYGTVLKAFVVVTLDDGKVVKTSGTGLSLYGVESGDKVTVAGTVKGFDNYNGQDQTTLTRVKLT